MELQGRLELTPLDDREARMVLKEEEARQGLAVLRRERLMTQVEAGREHKPRM